MDLRGPVGELAVLLEWRVCGSTETKERAMKDGNCPMCKSNEVYMTENKDNLRAGTVEGLFFRRGRVENLPSITLIPQQYLRKPRQGVLGFPR